MTITRTIAHQAETIKDRAKKIIGHLAGRRRLRTEGRGGQAKGNIEQA